MHLWFEWRIFQFPLLSRLDNKKSGSDSYSLFLLFVHYSATRKNNVLYCTNSLLASNYVPQAIQIPYRFQTLHLTARTVQRAWAK